MGLDDELLIDAMRCVGKVVDNPHHRCISMPTNNSLARSPQQTTSRKSRSQRNLLLIDPSFGEDRASVEEHWDMKEKACV